MHDFLFHNTKVENQFQFHPTVVPKDKTSNHALSVFRLLFTFWGMPNPSAESELFFRSECLMHQSINFFYRAKMTSTIKNPTIKRFAGILYLCFCNRIAMEFHFEFGFEESNLMRRSFHCGASIEASMVSSSQLIFQRKQTHNWRFSQTQFFFLSFCT